MISAFATVALVVGGALGSDDKSSVQLPGSLLIRVTESSFRAVNASSDDRLLVIGHGGVAVTAVLPAGSELLWPLETGFTNGVTLDVVTILPHAVVHTAAISIDLAQTGGAPLLLIATSCHTCSWALAGTVFLGATSAAPLASAAVSSTGCSCNAAGAAVHVPVVSPMEPSGPSTPPRLDPNPLPPI